MKREVLDQLIDKWNYSARDGGTMCAEDSEKGRINDAVEIAINKTRKQCAQELGDLMKLLSY